MFGFIIEDAQKYGPVLGFLGTIIGLVFTALQVRKNNQIQRARFLLDLTNRDLNKDGAWDLFFEIENGSLTNAELAEEKNSISLDALLYHFEIVGRLLDMGAISWADVDFYRYELKVVFTNAVVQEYLRRTDDIARARGAELPYPNARKMADDLNRKGKVGSTGGWHW